MLIVLALKERQVWVEVGYDLEQWITDGFAGETSRARDGAALPRPATTARASARAPRASSARIAQGRNVTLEGVPVPREPQASTDTPIPFSAMIMVFFAILMLSRIGRRPAARRPALGPRRLERMVERRRSVRRRLGWRVRRRVGGGFGGGFGGFGGGRSGGGGGGASW